MVGWPPSPEDLAARYATDRPRATGSVLDIVLTEPGKMYAPSTTISRQDMLVDGSDAEFREVIYALVQGVDRLLACRDAFARELTLTPSQFAVVLGIAHRQGADGITIGDLAGHVCMAPTHVTTEVRRLETAGLVRKLPDPDDRRSVRVSMTAWGEAEVERIAPLIRLVNDALFDGIGAEDLAIVRKIAKRITINYETAAAEIRKHRLTQLDSVAMAGE